MKMRWFVLSLCILAVIHSCGEDEPEDKCKDVVCQTPPGDTCQDANTLLVYAAPGTCDSATGECDYSSTEQACENGCSQGKCNAGGLCQGVTCDQPPPDECKDATTLLDYPLTGTCDPGTGLCEYPATEVTCNQFCENGVCDSDLGDDFALLAPANARLCTMFQGPDVFHNYAAKGILYFKEGLWRLPRDQASFESDLIDRVELGPDVVDLQPTGPGVFTRTIEGTPDDGRYIYEYRRPYDNDGDPFELTLRAIFQVQGGQADSPILTIDDADYLASHFCNTTISAWGTSIDWNNAFLTCQFDVREIFERWRVEVTVANGDQLTLHLRLSYKCCCFIGRDWAALVETRFVRGQDQRTVTDFYRQAFSAQHHIFMQNLLATFDTPLGNVHGILLQDADGADPVLEYLDADLNVIETPTITNLESIQE